ncbi:MAG: molybdopterin-dependent oxidoreductase [Pseudonocardiaceae bacterium]|nr:molybdopterin-dependent oxidoreductase [Pseudonocardiaceae bacterium]
MVTTTAHGSTQIRPRRLGAAIAGLIGVLGVASALAVGDLIAAVVSPSSSPFLAVGEQFIRLTPEWLKQFAIATFGIYDKLALLIGMALVITLLAAVAGLASRQRPAPGLVVIAVMGVLGLASILASPTFALFDLMAPLASSAVGLAVFAGLHHRAIAAAGREPAGQAVAGADPGTAATSAEDTGLDRRRLLWATGGVIAGAGAAGLLGRLFSSTAEASRAAVGSLPSPAQPRTAPPPQADFVSAGTPPWLTPNADFYRIDTALQVPQLSTGDYELRIHGMVDREQRLSYDDLRSRRLIEAPITMTCVSNAVGGSLMSNAMFLGVPLADLLAEAGVRPGATQIASTSVDGFTTGTPVDVVTDGRDAMLAIGQNGRPLPVEHGFPVRMVVPGLYGFVSGCKWITDIELTTFEAFTPYWEQRGWAQRAPIKTQSRIDAPRTDTTVPAGRVTVAGTAWAQHTGIAAVDVSADGGAWQRAELADGVSIDTWRMWKTTFELPPGRHRLQVRATDRSGYTQTPKPSLTIPDGATGWHTITVTTA